MSGTEIIFEVSEGELDGGYSASALGFGIHTQGDTMDELRRNVREAVDCYFDDAVARPAPNPVARRQGRSPGGVKVPRDVSGAVLFGHASLDGLREGSAAGLPRARHDTSRRRTPRGHPAARRRQGKDAVEHSEEHRPA